MIKTRRISDNKENNQDSNTRTKEEKIDSPIKESVIDNLAKTGFKKNNQTNRAFSADKSKGNTLTNTNFNKSMIATGMKKRREIPPKIAPIDPSLYKVSKEDVIKKYEEIKSGKRRPRSKQLVESLSESKSNRSSQENKAKIEKNRISSSSVKMNLKTESDNIIIQDNIFEDSSQIKIQNLSPEKLDSTQKHKTEAQLTPQNKKVKDPQLSKYIEMSPKINENLDKGININKLNVLNIALPNNKNTKNQKKSYNKKLLNSNMPLMKIMTRIIPLNIEKHSNRNNTSINDNKYKLNGSLNILPNNVKEGIIKETPFEETKVNKLKNSTELYSNINPLLISNKEALLDTSKCVYCLKRVKKPVTLSCKHEICLECGEEIKSLHEFLKEEDILINRFEFENYIIKCPLCDTKTNLPLGKFDDLLRKNWFPITDDLTNQEIMNKKKLNICEICPSSKVVKDFAEFECLNCDIIICYQCKIRHVSNPRHQDHKIIQVNQLIQEKVELSLCEKHREPLKLFCTTENSACCMVCANYENLHEGHVVKSIRMIIDNSTIELSASIRECEPQIKAIELLINQMQYIKSSLEEEQDFFLSKLNKTIEILMNLIKLRQEEITKSIQNIFEEKLKSLKKKLDNFTLISNRYNYYKNIVCDRDIDILERIKQLKSLNTKIHKLERKESIIWNNLVNASNPSLNNKNELRIDSLRASIFIEDPSESLKRSLEKFEFLPLTEKHFSILKSIFKESNIIESNLIKSEFLVTLPKIKSGCLLYKVSNDGCSPQTFHQLCDNKGPTILLVKTEDGHIFGGFNPISWISEYMYNESDESFLFSITDGKYRKPIKCPIKKSLCKFAIKQNENDYSPGFGEVDNADLFVAFYNLKNSYSNLGNVYKCPKGYNPREFLAGRPSDWKILEVEVYSVEIMDKSEFLNVINS